MSARLQRRGVHDVAIVGAGMVGAALALALARSGFDVALIESRAPAQWQASDDVDLRVVALAPSSIDFLQSVKVWDTIAKARVSAYRQMRVWDALAPGELHFEAVDSGAATLGYIVENRLIQSALWQAVQADARISVRCPAQVVTTQTEDDRRVLMLADDARVVARLVVAADGAESALRGLVGISFHQRDYAQRAIVAHVATQKPHQDTAWQRFLPGATLAFLPLADGRSSIVWSVTDADATRLLALDDAAFCSELAAAFDFRLGTIPATTARAAFPLRLRLAERYLAPRLAVIGDAAHVVHPLAGQGVNLGLRDAQELFDVLNSARDEKRDFAAESTLRHFERRRRSDNALAAYAFDAIQRGFGSSSPTVAMLRGAGLGLLDRLAPLKRMFARHAAGR